MSTRSTSIASCASQDWLGKTYGMADSSLLLLRPDGCIGALFWATEVDRIGTFFEPLTRLPAA
jgi:hypothetical protein